MATARARRRAKAAKAAPKGARKARRRGIPGTTVVHVDREVYALLTKGRKPEDRGMNAPLRRLLGLSEKTARRRRSRTKPAAAERPQAAAAPEPAAVS